MSSADAPSPVFTQSPLRSAVRGSAFLKSFVSPFENSTFPSMLRKCAPFSSPVLPLSAVRLIVCDSTAAVCASVYLLAANAAVASSSFFCALSKSPRRCARSFDDASEFSAWRASEIAVSAFFRGFPRSRWTYHQIPAPMSTRKRTSAICLRRSIEIRYQSMLSLPAARFFLAIQTKRLIAYTRKERVLSASAALRRTRSDTQHSALSTQHFGCARLAQC